MPTTTFTSPALTADADAVLTWSDLIPIMSTARNLAHEFEEGSKQFTTVYGTSVIANVTRLIRERVPSFTTFAIVYDGTVENFDARVIQDEDITNTSIDETIRFVLSGIAGALLDFYFPQRSTRWGRLETYQADADAPIQMQLITNERSQLIG